MINEPEEDILEDLDTILEVTSFDDGPPVLRFDNKPEKWYRPPFLLRPLVLSSSTGSSCSKATAYGDLGILPNEIWSEIIPSMDLASAIAFSQTCHAARLLCALAPEAKGLSIHAHDTLMAYVRSRLAARVTLRQLYQVLCSSDCEIDGQPKCEGRTNGLFMPTCTRICGTCLISRSCHVNYSTPAREFHTYPSDFLVMNASRLAQMIFDIPLLDLLPNIPAFLKVSPNNIGSDFNPNFYCTGPWLITSKDAEPYLRATVTDLTHSDILETYAHYELFEDEYMNDWAFSARTNIPAYNVITKEFDSGVYCRGCELNAIKDRKAGESFIEYSKMSQRYPKREGILAHIQNCETAKKMWFEASMEGLFCEGDETFDDWVNRFQTYQDSDDDR